VNVDDRAEPPTLSASATAPTPSNAQTSADVAAEASAGYAEVAAQAHRIVLPCCIIGFLVVVATAILKQAPAGVGVCVGLGLGMLNARLLQESVLRRFQVASGQPMKGGAFFAGGVTRLAAITGVAVVFAIVDRPLGIGVVAGLALYQVLLLSVSAAVMYRQVRA
jgi:hypothetical protein